MCDTRTNTIVSICRKGADAEHELGELLAELRRGMVLDREKLREAVAARGGTEALRFLEEALDRRLIQNSLSIMIKPIPEEALTDALKARRLGRTEDDSNER